MRIATRILLLMLMYVCLFQSCKKFEWSNPYDPDCPKSLFTPSSPSAEMQGNNVRISWNQDNDRISGFVLYRSSEQSGVTSLTQVQKTTKEYIDASLTPGKQYTYYILAVAGSNKSDTLKVSITPVFSSMVSTGAVTDYSVDTIRVEIAGAVSSGGGSSVTSRGICWSTTSGPTVSDSKTSEGTGEGSFVSTLTRLQFGTKYYARAYAENSRGVSYGNEVSFTTVRPPSVTTTALSNPTSTSVATGGTVDSDGGSPVTARGVCWAKTPNPTVSNSKTNNGTGVGTFVSNISSLESNTQYYIRAYATNAVGTSYGNELIFTTLSQQALVLSTTSVTSITSTGATGGGVISSDGGSTITARGVCWSLSPNPTVANSKTIDGSGTGSFTSSITGLLPSTTYHVRAYATNQNVTTYGEDVTFTTKSQSSGSDANFIPYINFNGTNTYVLVGQTDISTKINDLGGSFTMEGWVKSTLRNDLHQTIFSSGSDASGWWDYVVKLVSGRIIFAFRNGSNLTISTDFPNDTLWHHFALVYENKVASLIFIDGEQKIRSNNLGMSMLTSPNVSIGVSIDGIASPGHYLKGGIRQIRISKGLVYNTNFTPVLNSSTNSSTISFWDLGEGSGTKINSNLSGYSGTLMNGTWIKD